MLPETIPTNYLELYEDIKNPKLEAAIQTIFKMALTSKAFKFSEEVNKRLMSLAINIVKELDSYTNFKKIQIGLRTAEYLNVLTLEGVFQLVIGIGTHEIGHIRFTSKTLWDKYCMMARTKYGKLANTGKDILNIVEDRRIEYLISLVDERYADAINFMSAMLNEQKEKEFEEMEKLDSPTIPEKINQFMEGLIYASHTFKVYENNNFDEEVVEKLEKAIPFLVYSYKGTSTEDAIKVAEKIMEIISDWNEEINNDENESAVDGKMDDYKNSVGSYTPCEKDELDEVKEILETFSGKKEEMTEEEKKFREEMKKQLASDDEEKSDDNTDSKGSQDESTEEDGDSNEDGDSKDGSSNGSEDSETEEDGDSKGSSKDGSSKGDDDSDSEEDGSSKGSSKGDSSNGDEDSDSEENGSSKGSSKNDSSENDDSDEEGNSSKEDSEITTLNMDDYLERAVSEKSKATEGSLKTIETTPLTAKALDDFMSPSSKYKRPTKGDKIEKARIEDIVSNSDIDDIHKGTKLSITKPTDKLFEKDEYKAIAKKHKQILEEAAREINRIKISYAKKNIRNRKKGRFDTRDLTKIATNTDTIYKDSIKIQDGILGMEIGILVDSSGSNCHSVYNPETGNYLSRYLVNQEIAITLHELCKNAGIRHFCWSFDESGYVTQIDNMIDFANCFDKDSGLNLSAISAKSNNRDGLAIKAAGTYLSEYNGEKDAKKLLIVISDGQPYGISYNGASALKDVRYQIDKLKGVEKGKPKKASRNNSKLVKTIGIFSGDENENKYFEVMYENAIYANGNTIFELPKKLAKLIVDEFGGKR